MQGRLPFSVIAKQVVSHSSFELAAGLLNLLLRLRYMKQVIKMLHVTNGVEMSTPTTQRVQKHREGLRAAGMRPVQIWVPDTRREDFALECKRQSLLLKNDPHEVATQNWLQTVADTTGWQ